jgi:hypothetical protein
MYKSILLPLDGSKLAETILPEIEKVASCMQARVILLRVCRAHVFPEKDPTEAEVEVVRKAEKYLGNMEAQLTAAPRLTGNDVDGGLLGCQWPFVP